MTRVVHVVDGSCGHDALQEAALLAGQAEGFVCIGLPQEELAWSELLAGARIIAKVPAGTVSGPKARKLEMFSRAGWVAQCWSISAARTFALHLSPATPAAVRIAAPPSARQVGWLGELALEGKAVALACQGESVAGRVRAANVSAVSEVIAPPAEVAERTPAGRLAARERLGIAPDEVAILVPGRAHRASGHRYAVWAAAILTVAELPVRLVIQATGAGAREAVRFAREAGFAEQVLHPAPSTPLAELVAAADLAVFLGADAVPGVALATAMLAALPIVAGNVPAATDWLTDGKRALLVRPDGPREIARAVMAIIDDKALARRLGKAAHSFAARNFDAAEVRGRWAALHERLLSGAAVTKGG